MAESIPIGRLESGGNAASFESIGDQHAGTITDIDPDRPQTDLDGNVKTWNDGRPRTIIVITVETDEGDSVQLWAKGGSNYVAKTGEGTSMADAIGQAVRTAGVDSLVVGGKLAVRHTGLSEPKAGMNPAKLYRAQYQPPQPKSTSVPADLFSS
jgi:hypothetical protein